MAANPPFRFPSRLVSVTLPLLAQEVEQKLAALLLVVETNRFSQRGQILTSSTDFRGLFADLAAHRSPQYIARPSFFERLMSLFSFTIFAPHSSQMVSLLDTPSA